MSDPRLRTAAWQSLRLVVLDRDLWQCQVKGDGCLGFAGEVDHIISTVDDPASFWDVANLRASCKRCNARRGAEVTNRRRRGARRYPPVRM
jgi:5-methylcytosine-specific restriction endonuclease McrA